MVKVLKQLSIGNLGFAISGTPLLHYITSQTGNGGKGIAMAALLLSFGGATTGAITWATGTYVLALRALPGGSRIEIDTLTLLGGTKTFEAEWTDIQQCTSWHPFATFQARGKIFYLDEDGLELDKGFVPKLEEMLNRETE